MIDNPYYDEPYDLIPYEPLPEPFYPAQRSVDFTLIFVVLLLIGGLVWGGLQIGQTISREKTGGETAVQTQSQSTPPDRTATRIATFDGAAIVTDPFLPYREGTQFELFPDGGLHGVGYWPGRDYISACGTPLFNPLPGETAVKDRGIDNYCGRWGCNNPYLHLNNGRYKYMLLHGDYVVNVGDTLRQGDLIGFEASNGNSSECHSHISVRSAAGALLDVVRLNQSPPATP